MAEQLIRSHRLRP